MALRATPEDERVGIDRSGKCLENGIAKRNDRLKKWWHSPLPPQQIHPFRK